MKYPPRFWLSGFTAPVILFLLLHLLFSCGSESIDSYPQSDAEKSSANIIIRWPHAELKQDKKNFVYTTALDCQAANVEQVVCDVYSEYGNLLVNAGPWPCSANGAIVDGIPAGENRIFIALGLDPNQNIRYYGETTGILIEPDLTTEGVVVDTVFFIPELTAPEDSIQVDPAGFAFTWEDIAKAHEYIIKVAEDRSFEVPTIDTTTYTNSFAPANLSPSTQYFWKVQAVDRFGYLGAETVDRSFFTTDCTYSISSIENTFLAEGGSDNFEVTASSDDCRWIAASNADWIQITEGTEDSGNGRVSYNITANPSSVERTGTITAGGEIHTITQQGMECAYQITPTGRDFGESGGIGTIDIITTAEDCPWEAASDSDWITITQDATGNGDGTVTYEVAPNIEPLERRGTITIMEEPHTIVQAGQTSCTFQISPTRREFGLDGGNGTIDIIASGPECQWHATSDDAWIEITGEGIGDGDGTVTYNVLGNDTQQERTGVIIVGGHQHTVYQQGPEICTYQISPAGREFDESGGSDSFQITTNLPDCAWTAVSDRDWLQITSGNSGNGNGTVNYTVLANDTEADRTGIITVGEQQYRVNQEPPSSSPIDQYVGNYSLVAFESHGRAGDYTQDMVENWYGSLTIASNGNVNETVSIGGIYDADVYNYAYRIININSNSFDIEIGGCRSELSYGLSNGNLTLNHADNDCYQVPGFYLFNTYQRR